jgi:chromate transporter
VAFVGFVGGWTTEFLGSSHVMNAAILAACLVTYFTFLPSFVFVLLGGPIIESTHGILALTAPLTAITAAVVGVIVNLALFFAYHVLWPNGGGFDLSAAVIGIGAALALVKFRVGVITVIFVSAVVGLLLTLLPGWIQQFV